MLLLSFFFLIFIRYIQLAWSYCLQDVVGIVVVAVVVIVVVAVVFVIVDPRNLPLNQLSNS